MPIQQTPFLVLSNVVFVLILFLLTRTVLVDRGLPILRRRFVILLVFLFCLFSFWGADWFHYFFFFNGVKEGLENFNEERLYVWLVENICPNYLVFRGIVWGLALFLFIKTLKNLDINIDYALFFFCSIYLIWFSYARVSLAMSLMFYGYSLIVSSYRKRMIGLIVGIALIGLSYFFHKSALFGIAIVSLALLAKITKKEVVFLFILLFTFPLIIYIISSYLGSGVEAIMSDEESIMGEYMTSGNRYLEADKSIRGVGNFIVSLLERIPYYLIAWGCLREMIKNKTTQKGAGSFCLLTILIVLLSSVFLFNIGMNTHTVYVRFMRFAEIPACISLTYLYQNDCSPKLIRFTYKFAIIGTFGCLLYVLYTRLF